MQYLTAYFRQQGEEENSLLLQQYLCRRLPVCFACLCTCRGNNRQEAGRYVTGQLLNWCRRFPWHKAAKRPDRWLKRAERELKTEIRRSMADTSVSWRVLLAVGEELLTMGNGQELILLSMALGKGAVTGLEGNFRGQLEPGAGILLTTDGFLGCGEESITAEVLRLSELRTEEQAGRRLKELMRRAGETGRGGMAAILLVTRDGCDE